MDLVTLAQRLSRPFVFREGDDPRPGASGLSSVSALPDGRVVAVGERGRILVQDSADWHTAARRAAIACRRSATWPASCTSAATAAPVIACYHVRSDLTLVHVPGPTHGTFGFTTYRGRGYSASQASGVMALEAGKLETVARPLQPYGIAAQDDRMVVHGDHQVALLDGESWHPLDVGSM